MEDEKFFLGEDIYRGNGIYLFEKGADFYNHGTHDRLVAEFYCGDIAKDVCKILNKKENI